MGVSQALVSGPLLRGGVADLRAAVGRPRLFGRAPVAAGVVAAVGETREHDHRQRDQQPAGGADGAEDVAHHASFLDTGAPDGDSQTG